MGQAHRFWLCQRGHDVEGIWSSWRDNTTSWSGKETGGGGQGTTGPFKGVCPSPKDHPLGPHLLVYHPQIIHLWRLALLIHRFLGTFRMQTRRDAQRVRVSYFLFSLLRLKRMRFVHLSQEEDGLEMYIREAVEAKCGKCCRDAFIMVSILVDLQP